MNTTAIAFDLDTLIANGDLDTIRGRFDREHPADIGAMINELDARPGWAALELLPLTRRADTFGYLDHDFQVELATVAPRAELAAIVEMNGRRTGRPLQRAFR